MENEQLLRSLMKSGELARQTYYRALVRSKVNLNCNEINLTEREENDHSWNNPRRFRTPPSTSSFSDGCSDQENQQKRSVRTQNPPMSINACMSCFKYHLDMASCQCECYFDSCPTSSYSEADKRHIQAYHLHDVDIESRSKNQQSQRSSESSSGSLRRGGNSSSASTYKESARPPKSFHKKSPPQARASKKSKREKGHSSRVKNYRSTSSEEDQQEESRWRSSSERKMGSDGKRDQQLYVTDPADLIDNQRQITGGFMPVSKSYSSPSGSDIPSINLDEETGAFSRSLSQTQTDKTVPKKKVSFHDNSDTFPSEDSGKKNKSSNAWSHSHNNTASWQDIDNHNCNCVASREQKTCHHFSCSSCTHAQRSAAKSNQPGGNHNSDWYVKGTKIHPQPRYSSSCSCATKLPQHSMHRSSRYGKQKQHQQGICLMTKPGHYVVKKPMEGTSADLVYVASGQFVELKLE